LVYKLVLKTLFYLLKSMNPLSKNELKLFRSLAIKKYRHQAGLFIAEGRKIVFELLQSSFTIKEIFLTPEWLESNKDHLPNDLSYRLISSKQAQQLSSLKQTPGIAAVIEIPKRIFKTTQKYTLLLEKINDPGNLGTLIRIADWFGWSNILCTLDSVDCFNPKTIQSSMGSIGRVSVYYQDWSLLLNQNDLPPIYAADMNGSSIYDCHFDKPCWLILGSESHGLSMTVKEHKSIQPITIPSMGSAESLNVAVAGGIILSEMARGSMVGNE